MYSNDNINRNKSKVSIYDYQKIQSTHNNSQFLGQRHYLMGGPSSGHHQSIVKDVHQERVFKRSSPSPGKTFDEVRGASPELNSYNNIIQFMPTYHERPRLTVL